MKHHVPVANIVAVTSTDADQHQCCLVVLCAALVTVVASRCFLAPSLQVPHVRQHYNWDCGLACVLMVLRAMGVHGIDFYTLRQCCGTTRCGFDPNLLGVSAEVSGEGDCQV